MLSKKCVLLGATRQVKAIVAGCQACLQRKRVQQKLGLMASKPPRAPWHTVAMDFCGPYIPSRQGYRYVPVFVDQFTKWVELVPTKDQVAATVVKKFYERPSSSGSAPEVPPSDTRRITIEPEPRSLEIDETTRYDVGRIHASRFVGRRKEFLVEWAGYPDPTDYTWQPRKELEEDVPRVVRQYERMERTRRIEAEQAEARARAEEQVSLRRAHQERRRRRFARGD